MGNSASIKKVSAGGGSLKQSPQLKNTPAQLQATQIDESKKFSNLEQTSNHNLFVLDSASNTPTELIKLDKEYENSMPNIPVPFNASSEIEQLDLVDNKDNLLDSTFDTNQNPNHHKGKHNSTLSIATSSCIEDSKNVSSDDEIFDECQSFLSISTNATQTVDKPLLSPETHYSLGENFVSSVTSTNVENHENDVASGNSNINGSPNDFGVADSTTNNSSINENTFTPYVLFPESCEPKAEKQMLMEKQNDCTKETSSDEIGSKALSNTGCSISLNSEGESSPTSKQFPTKMLDNSQPSFPTSPKSSEILKNTGTDTYTESLSHSLNLFEENQLHTTLNKTHDKTTSSDNVDSIEQTDQQISLEMNKTVDLHKIVNNTSFQLDNLSNNSSNVALDHTVELTTSHNENSIKEENNETDLNQIREDNVSENKIDPQENQNLNLEIKKEHTPEKLDHFENMCVINNSEKVLNHTFVSSLDNFGNDINNLTIDNKSPSNNKNQITIKTETNNSYEDMDIDISCVSEHENVANNINTTFENVFYNNGEENVNPFYNNNQVDSPMMTSSIKCCDFQEPTNKDFQCNGLILNSCDFDYLLTKGNDNIEVNRSSLLLRFDPLLGIPVPVNIAQTQSFNNPLTSAIGKQQSRLSPAVEEDENNDNNCNQSLKSSEIIEKSSHNSLIIKTNSIKKHAAMSVDLIKEMKSEHDIKSIDNFDSRPDGKVDYNMDGLQKKIKNEVIKSEEDEKRSKDSEQREEALLKRITEKEKTMAKMNGVIEAYEKAIAELIAEKEQIIQKYEAELLEVKADRDSNYRHLTSLETTFSDLHVKYEKSKEMTTLLKNNEEALKQEKFQNLQNLRLQEQRYEKMKNHAMQQLEIANKKLESLTRNHSNETTKLKALLKKEEVSRASMQEQLNHKSRENEELVKICDELINGQGS